MEARKELESALSAVSLATREIVFLSHANPEDNDFVIWLGARLTELGYEVWSDVIRLKGAEPFWTDIEDVIRNKAARVVVCLSRAAILKDGFRNEIAIAKGVAKKIPGFIVPVVIDPSFSYDDHLPAQIAQQNCISFTPNWSKGFVALEELFKDFAVPKPNKDLSHYVELWKFAQTNSQNSLVEISEHLSSNWFPIVKFPETLLFYGITKPLKLNELSSLCKDLYTPAFPLNRFLCGHGSIEEYQQGIGDCLRFDRAVETIDFIEASPGLRLGMRHQDAKKLYINLITKAWDRRMADLGLIDYEMANNIRAWFLPDGLVPGNKITFKRPDGSNSWRCLVGRNNTRGVYWHFAISAKPTLHNPRRIQLSAHVVFTTDGKTLISDVKKVQSFRKATCKQWFNSKWRDLLFGFTTFVSQGGDVIAVPVGSGQQIEIAASPMSWISPVSYMLDEPATMTDESELIEELKRKADPGFVDYDEANDTDLEGI